MKYTIDLSTRWISWRVLAHLLFVASILHRIAHHDGGVWMFALIALAVASFAITMAKGSRIKYRGGP